MERFYLTRAYLTRAFSHSQGQVETVAGLFSKVGFEPNAVVVETLLTVAERLSLTTRYSFVSENRIGTAFSFNSWRRSRQGGAEASYGRLRVRLRV